MENQQKEIFANCSQTHFAMRKFRRPISQCENFATQNSQCENFAMRNFAMPNAISQCQNRFRNANFNFAMRKFRNAKFRNAKCHFAMPNFEFTLPIPISQCENLAIPNSQCENFAMRNFAMPKPISHCENHCLCEIHPAKFTGLVILCN